MKPAQSFWIKNSNYLVLLLFIISNYFIFRSAFSGIAFADDGYSLLSAKYPQNIVLNFNLSYVFTSVIYKVTYANVGVFRLFTVFMNIFCVLILAYSVLVFLGYRLANQFKLFLGLFLVFYLSNSIIFMHNMNPDYNFPTRCIAMIQAGLILTFLNNKSFNLYHIFLLGFITAFQLLFKLPSFIVSLMVLFFVAMFFQGIYYKKVMAILLGVGIGIFLIYVLFSPYNLLHVLLQGMKYTSSGVHGIKLLYNNLFDIFNCLLDVTGLYILYVLWGRSRLLNIQGRTRILIIIVAIFLVAGIRFILGGGNGETGTVIGILGRAIFNGSMLMMVYNLHSAQKIKGFNTQFKVHLASFCLLGLAYSVSVGTDTPIFYHVMFSGSLLLTVLILQFSLMEGVAVKILVRNANFLSVYLSIILTAGLSLYSAGYNNLFAQKISYSIEGGKIYIDQSTLTDINLVKNAFARCKFQKDDYILGFYGLPSIIYVAGGSFAVTPWNFPVPSNWNWYFTSSIKELSDKHQLFLLADLNRFNRLENSVWLDRFHECATFQLSGKSKFPAGNYVIYWYN